MTPEAEAREISKTIFRTIDKLWSYEKFKESDEAVIKIIATALRKYQSRIEELEGKLFGQTEELLYLREHVTGGNDGLYLPPKQYNNLSETTKALESFYRKEFDKIKAALESTNSKLREGLEMIARECQAEMVHRCGGLDPDSEKAKNLRVLTLLRIPRDIARNALASKESEGGKP